MFTDDCYIHKFVHPAIIILRYYENQMGQLKSKIKTALLRGLPFIAKHRFVVIGYYKQAFVFLRYLPGSSKLYGPPRGIYKDAEAYNAANKTLQIQEFLIKDGATHTRRIPSTNSELVLNKFKGFLDTELIPKNGYILKDARYLYGNGGTVITSDDKIFLPASPLRNEWIYKRHQSLYLLKVESPVALDKVILIDTKACEDNYYHWLKDHITRFGWLRKMNLNLADYTLVSSYGNFPFQEYTLSVLAQHGFTFKDFKDAAAIKSFSAKELVIPAYTTIALNGDHITFDTESKDFLQEMFVVQDLKEMETYDKIYLSRRRSNRTSAQESVLVEELEKLGVKEIFLEDYNVSQQAALFNNAGLIIGFHGAGFTNLLFCKPGTVVVEIFGADFIVSDFWAIADQTQLDYHAYCDDEYHKGIENYRLSRLSPTLMNVSNFLVFLNSLQEKHKTESKL